MATELHVAKDSFEAAADLSAAQYKFVKLDSNGRIAAIAAATDIPIGVLQDKPNALGKVGEVVIIGRVKIQADAALTRGTQIGPSADGQADAKTAGTDLTEYIVGQIVEAAAAAGELATAWIDCAAPHRAA